MAISFDKSGSATGTTNASIALAAAEANELAIIVVDIFTSDLPIGTPTVNGSSAGVTQFGGDFTGIRSGQTIRFYYLVNPPTSSVPYATTGEVNGVQIYVGLYKGAAQSGIPDSINHTDSTVSVGITLSTTVVASNCWLFSLYEASGSGANNNTAGTGTTIRETIASSSIGDSNGVVGTGSQSMGWVGARTNSGGIILSIAPVGAIGATANNLSLVGVGT